MAVSVDVTRLKMLWSSRAKPWYWHIMSLWPGAGLHVFWLPAWHLLNTPELAACLVGPSTSSGQTHKIVSHSQARFVVVLQ